MLDEYKKVKHIFKRPKLHCYFGFWQTPTWILNIKLWLSNNSDQSKTIKYKLASIVNKLFGLRSDPCLPVWRRGNIIRIFKNKQVYNYQSDNRGYVWQDDFRTKLEKLHLSWLKPSYELPIWLSFHYFNFPLCWKWKYDDVRFEFPPQISFVFFGISFSMWWSQPESKDGDMNMYWESILNYLYKYTDTLKGRNVTIPEQLCELSDYCGYWGTIAQDDSCVRTWNVHPDYIRNKEYARIVKEHQDKKELEIIERYKKVACPKCGKKMRFNYEYKSNDDSKKYECICPECGEKKYLDEKIETYFML